jgi:hypothetical protein
MKKTVLTSALALAVAVVSAEAQQFPYRQPGPYRTAFVETATKACIRANLEYPANADVPKDAILKFCDCKATVMATFATAKDVEEAAQGGMHPTPRTAALEQTAETACLKAFTGQ